MTEALYFNIGYICGIAGFIITQIPTVFVIIEGCRAFINEEYYIDPNFLEWIPWIDCNDFWMAFLLNIIIGIIIAAFVVLIWMVIVPLAILSGVVFGLLLIARSITRLNRKLSKLEDL